MFHIDGLANCSYNKHEHLNIYKTQTIKQAASVDQNQHLNQIPKILTKACEDQLNVGTLKR